MTWSRQSSGIYIHDCLRIESASMMDVGSKSVCACCPQRNFLTRQVLISGSHKPFPGRSLLLLSTSRLLPSRFNHEPPESTLCPTCSSVRRTLHFLSTERRLTRTDTTRGSQPIMFDHSPAMLIANSIAAQCHQFGNIPLLTSVWLLPVPAQRIRIGSALHFRPKPAGVDSSHFL